MKQTVNFYDFCDAFRDHNREDNFSYEGKRTLFDFLESLEDDTGQEQELDIIALCCDFDEWENFAEFKKEHGNIKTKEKINDYTTFIDIDGTSFITQVF
jgi:hypothetical protein